MNSLITYTGNIPVNVSMDGVKDSTKKNLFLRPNNTTEDVSPAELDKIKSVLGDLAFNRLIVVHDVKRIREGAKARKELKEKELKEKELKEKELKEKELKEKENKKPMKKKLAKTSVQ
jgi:hypothetical protein